MKYTYFCVFSGVCSIIVFGILAGINLSTFLINGFQLDYFIGAMACIVLILIGFYSSKYHINEIRKHKQLSKEMFAVE